MILIFFVFFNCLLFLLFFFFFVLIFLKKLLELLNVIRFFVLDFEFRYFSFDRIDRGGLFFFIGVLNFFFVVFRIFFVFVIGDNEGDEEINVFVFFLKGKFNFKGELFRDFFFFFYWVYSDVFL